MEILDMPALNTVLETLQRIQLPVSMTHLLVILGLLGASFYFGHYKYGLIGAFFAVNYWAFTSNQALFVELTTGSFFGMLAAVVVGLAVAFVGFVGFMQETR